MLKRLLPFILLGHFAFFSCTPIKKEVRYEPLEKEEKFHHREAGLASWYGEEFQGRQTANGEIYNMYAMTAAHRTLPFNTHVQVTNLENGKKAELRINDRGPFVAGRIIDLSYSGAGALDMVGTGTAKVIVEAIGFPGGDFTSQEANFTIQVGAFAEKENATRFQASLGKRYPNVHIVLWESNFKRLYRVCLGKFPTETEARRYTDTLRRENITGFILRED